MADKLDAKRFGLAGALLYGAAAFGLTLISAATGYAKGLLDFWGTWHPGYTVSYAGSIVGLVYGLVCGFIGAYVFAWLYNSLEGKV